MPRALLCRWSVPAIAVALLLTSAALAQPADERAVWTLYRENTVDHKTAVHIATFDAAQGERYNREHCLIVRDLLQGPPGGRIRYWCEPGWAPGAQGRRR